MRPVSPQSVVKSLVIRCPSRSVVYRLEESPAYRALSYSLGEAATKVKVKCDDLSHGLPLTLRKPSDQIQSIPIAKKAAVQYQSDFQRVSPASCGVSNDVLICGIVNSSATSNLLAASPITLAQTSTLHLNQSTIPAFFSQPFPSGPAGQEVRYFPSGAFLSHDAAVRLSWTSIRAPVTVAHS